MWARSEGLWRGGGCVARAGQTWRGGGGFPPAMARRSLDVAAKARITLLQQYSAYYADVPTCSGRAER